MNTLHLSAHYHLEFVHYHEWTKGDLVIWDSRMTMHRARPYDDIKYKRELTRVTTLDMECMHQTKRQMIRE